MTLTDKLIFFLFFIQQKVRSLSIDTGILVSGLVFFFYNFPEFGQFSKFLIFSQAGNYLCNFPSFSCCGSHGLMSLTVTKIQSQT